MEKSIFKDLPATPEALEIERATRSLFHDMQTVDKTFGYESETPMDKAARKFAEEVQRELKTWEAPKPPEPGKVIDTVHTSGATSTRSNTSAGTEGITTPTIDDTEWTSDAPKDASSPKGGSGSGTVAFDAEQIKRTQKALAKGLPALASGIRDAVRGFEKGDPFAGSAAVMDICATLASTVGSMTAAGGPPGALIGALFSLLSTVLKAFMKPQNSLISEIEEVVRKVAAETKQEELASAQGAIDAVIASMKPGLKWKFSEILSLFSATDGTAINSVRSAATWLETPGNQELKLWGPVLAQQCQTYIMMMQLLGIVSASVDVSKDSDGGANTYGKLAALFTSNDASQLRFLRSIASVAQDRGTLWHIGVFDATGEYPDSGNLFFVDSVIRASRDDWEKAGGEQRAFTVSRTRTRNTADPNPYLAVFALEKADTQRAVPGAAYRHRKNARTYGLFGKWPLKSNTTGWRKIENLEGLNDICATPGDEPRTVYVYTADDSPQIKRYTHGENPVGNGDIRIRPEQVFTADANCTVDSVAAVAGPQTAAGDEAEILQGESFVLYGGGHNKFRARYLHAFFNSGVAGQIRLPANLDSSLVGLRADNRRLWVFTRRMIFCATHSSVKEYLRRVRGAGPAQLSSLPGPKWASYKVPAELGGAWQTEGRYDGLQEIAPCDDGTLWAVFADKGGNKNMYCATPGFENPDVIAIGGVRKDAFGHDIATNGWTKFEAKANRIQKQAIFCWSILEQLTEALEKPGRRSLTAGA